MLQASFEARESAPWRRRLRRAERYQIAPTAENGTASETMAVFTSERVFR
jgi:hypothetical protein